VSRSGWEMLMRQDRTALQIEIHPDPPFPSKGDRPDERSSGKGRSRGDTGKPHPYEWETDLVPDCNTDLDLVPDKSWDSELVPDIRWLP